MFLPMSWCHPETSAPGGPGRGSSIQLQVSLAKWVIWQSNITNDIIWDNYGFFCGIIQYMVMIGYVWLCITWYHMGILVGELDPEYSQNSLWMAMYGYVWLYVVIYGYMWLYTTCGYMFGNDHLLTEMYIQVSPFPRGKDCLPIAMRQSRLISWKVSLSLLFLGLPPKRQDPHFQDGSIDVFLRIS